MDSDQNIFYEIMAFLDKQQELNFFDYQSVFDFIDITYDGFIKHYFDNLAKQLS